MLLKPSIPHPLIGENICSSEDLARLAKSMQIDADYSVILYVGSRQNVTAIQEVPDGLIKRENECVGYIRGRMREFGASLTFLVTPNQQIKDIATDLVKKGYLTDAIATGGMRFTSVRESGVGEYEESSSKWMGISSNKGFRVRENGREI